MNNRAWILGTVAFSLVVLVLGWFLAISPRVTELTDNAIALAAAQEQQAAARGDLEALKAQFSEIDSIRAQLATLQLSLPIDGDYPDLHKEVSDLCDLNDVSLTGWVNNTPVYIAATTAGPPVDPNAAPDPSATNAPAPATPADGQPAAGGNLLAIPVDITVVHGKSFTPLFDFVKSLRESSRLLVVTGFTTEVKEVDGRPQFSLTVSVFVYSVINPDAAVTPTTPVVTPTPTPTGTESPSPSGVPTVTNTPTP